MMLRFEREAVSGTKGSGGIRAAFLPLLAFGASLGLASCAHPNVDPSIDASPPSSEPLYQPDQVKPGRLEYAPDRSTFAPILTERFPYPTQRQAQDAYRRLLADAPRGGLPYPASIWLFGCRPGSLNAETVRLMQSRAPVVHCATDLLDPAGRRTGRLVANFSYVRSQWVMLPVYPPRSTVPWLDREGSPRDVWWWAPGRDRYK